MRKVYLCLLAAFGSLLATASTTYNVCGTEFRADTLFHSQIGPGTTQTSLFMTTPDGKRDMYVYYARVDLTNPYIMFRTVMGHDKISEAETVRHMAERKSEPGKRYFLGVNGDFFYTSGQTSRGVSRIGIPIGPCIVDGEIYKANNNSSYTQFVLDAEKQRPLIGNTRFSGFVMNAAGTKVNVGGVNVVNPSANNNRVLIYNSHYFAGTDVNDGGAEIAVALAEGESFVFGRPFKMVATAGYSTAGDMDIPENGYVLHGQGTGSDLIKGLNPGDTVTVEFHAKMGNEEIDPYTMMSSWPRTLDNGTVINPDDQKLLDEFSSQQPVTGVGLADGGKTIVILTIDGRSPKSSGARTDETGDLMRQLGVTDALNMDSGGSSTFYTAALGVRNVPSDGAERPDGNGLFAVYSAPDDSTVCRIEFVDWVVKVPKYGVYTPKFYGYNQYGVLVDTDVQGVTISAPESVGHVQEGANFFGDGSGDGVLTGHLGDMTCTVPVQILGMGDGIAIKNDSIINDGYHTYTVEVTNTYDGVTLPIDASVLTWSSSDESVVAIDAQSGQLKGVANGTAYVYGKVGEFADTLKVIVEIPSAREMSIDPAPDMSTWKISQSGGKNGVATTNGDGFDYTYTGASSRSPKITLSKTLQLWSIPDAFVVRLDVPDGAPVQSVTLGLRANGEAMSYQPVELKQLSSDSSEKWAVLETSSWTDAANIGRYPITLSSIQLNMGTSATGQDYTICFKDLHTVYYAVPAAVKGDVNGDGIVNASDVDFMVSMLLTEQTLGKQVDINGDGVFNASDVGALVSIILGQ